MEGSRIGTVLRNTRNAAPRRPVDQLRQLNAHRALARNSRFKGGFGAVRTRGGYPPAGSCHRAACGEAPAESRPPCLLLHPAVSIACFLSMKTNTAWLGVILGVVDLGAVACGGSGNDTRLDSPEHMTALRDRESNSKSPSAAIPFSRP
jgi:hypothetical protein